MEWLYVVAENLAQDQRIAVNLFGQVARISVCPQSNLGSGGENRENRQG